MVVSLNYCSQNGGNLYSAPYYNGNPNIGPRIIGNLDQSPYAYQGLMENENGQENQHAMETGIVYGLTGIYRSYCQY